MLTVGLTGSIAVGKSFVCGVFAELGCRVLDADKTAREVVAPGTEGLRAIAREFGRDVLMANGMLDRGKLGAIVFADPEKRQRLNAIVHPLVIERQNEWLTTVADDDPNAIAIIDAALMIESGGYERFERLIVVWCRSDIQLRRLMERDGLSMNEAVKRIEAQMPQDEKKTYADHLIDTSEGFDDTREQVNELHKELKALAAQGTGSR